MMTQSKQLIAEIRSIRDEYFHEVGEGKRRAWPRAIKERVLKLCDLGEFRTKDIARLTSISAEVIGQWRYLAKKELQQGSAFHSLPVVAGVGTRSMAQSPTLTEPATVTVPDFIKHGIRVTTQDGYVIEGLTADSTVLVMQGLRGVSGVF